MLKKQLDKMRSKQAASSDAAQVLTNEESTTETIDHEVASRSTSVTLAGTTPNISSNSHNNRSHIIPCICMTNCHCSFAVSVTFMAVWSAWETIITLVSGYQLSLFAIILQIFYCLGTISVFIGICCCNENATTVLLFLLVALVKAIVYVWTLVYMIEYHVHIYFNKSDISVGVWLCGLAFAVMWIYFSFIIYQYWLNLLDKKCHKSKQESRTKEIDYAVLQLQQHVSKEEEL